MSDVSWADVAELESWLRAREVTMAGWGEGEAKTVENLWHEVQGGETLLVEEGDMVLRLVSFVQVIIRRGDRWLVEAEQVLADGRVRRRAVLPSEKFKRGESYALAAGRCLAEELNVGAGEFELLTETYRWRKERMERPTYPGLETLYTFHQVEVVVAGLPDDNFETENRLAGPSDPVRIHRWEWRLVEGDGWHYE
ncbi:MAG TPA: hypothetical protein VLL52_08685 [Anaerolineae bacterium]|nr:hypothetical protein [Anaerolineae bacterium]